MMMIMLKMWIPPSRALEYVIVSYVQAWAHNSKPTAVGLFCCGPAGGKYRPKYRPIAYPSLYFLFFFLFLHFFSCRFRAVDQADLCRLSSAR